MRTPLSTLSLTVAILDQLSPPLNAQIIRGLRTSISRLTLLVNGVMRLERFKPDDLPVHTEPIRPAKLVDHVISENEHDAMRKGLRLEVQVNRSTVILADPDLLLDALGNLVQNAVKYTEKGFVRVKVDEDADSVTFQVQDSGPGMPPERRNDLFKAIAPAKPGGVGIGLLVAHRAVAAQGGEIDVTSEVGKGTSFRFTIPREVKQRAQPTGSE
jgi:signal transduction histidine kinase